ncbi:ribonuclease P protein component [Pyruvatibacter sp.]|uniref:ribonuclease P protein component n=1 Tax=Pyruvatibacter sp. TaxID=1981328 RepID=UPI0032631EF9
MIERLKKRADFLQAARGKRAAMPGLVLQMRPYLEKDGDSPFRVGFTVTKKVGNAVVRNRAKRRLRAAAEAMLPRYGLPGRDYVVIGRAGTLSRPFALLLGDLERALAKVHGRAHLSPSDPSIPGSAVSETHPDDDRRKS